MAMHAFLQGVCSDVLACVWKLCVPQGMAQVPEAQQSPLQELQPLTAQVLKAFLLSFHTLIWGCFSGCSRVEDSLVV